MNIGWYLAVSALVFCIGAGGVLTRRNPLVVLLCLELMLNAANLALIAFSRMWGNGDGQIFAIIVMVVAACEVCIGLGLVVAIYRRRLPIDVDELRELQRMTPMRDRRLARPAVPAGRLRSSSALGFRVLARAASSGCDRHGSRSPPSFVCAVLTLAHAPGPRRGAAPGRLHRVGLRRHRRRRREALDPRRPAVACS